MYRSHVVSRCRVAIASLLVGGLLSACSGSNGSVVGLSRNAGSAKGSVSYNFTPVPNPLGPSGTFNQVTGININREIVGNYLDSVGVSQSYVSTYGGLGGYSSFTSISYPDAPQGTVMTGISSPSGSQTPIEVGWVTNPAGQVGNLNGIWGVFDNQGMWSIGKKTSGENNCNTPTDELLAYNQTQNFAVGFYSSGTGNCVNMPYEELPGDKHQDISIPPSWANGEATGVDDSGDIVGTTTITASGKPVGWYRTSGGAIQTYSYPVANLTATVFTGIKTTGTNGVVIVGYYTANSQTHGLVFTPGNGANPWATVDEPNAYLDKETVVNGINNNGDICGWYLDQHGSTDGFVGIVGGLSPKRQHHQKERSNVDSIKP